MADGEHRRDHHDDGAEEQRGERRKRRRRDDDRHEEEDGERVLQAAGDEQERTELQRVIGEEQECRLGAEPMARRKADAEREVERRRKRNQPDAPEEREREAEAEIDHCHGYRLARHRQPAQTNQGLEPEAPACEVALRGRHCPDMRWSRSRLRSCVSAQGRGAGRTPGFPRLLQHYRAPLTPPLRPARMVKLAPCFDT